jgi:hypothetical protein
VKGRSMRRAPLAMLLVCLLVPAACGRAKESTATAALSQDEAVALIMNLPQCRAWGDAVEKASGGEAHAAYVVQGEWKAPPLDCWQVWRVEDHADHTVRNEIFLVDKNTRAIFVYDEFAPEGKDLVPLAQWHQEWPS